MQGMLVFVAVAGLALGGCSEGSSFGGGGGDGSGGSGSGEGGSAGGVSNACGQDCSAIETPVCLESVCDESTGQCVVQNASAGTTCDDGMFCTVDDTCQEGMCVGGPPNTCGLELAPCEKAICNEGSQSCTATPSADGDPCGAEDLCTVGATCQNGVCSGSPKDCFFAPTPDDCHVSQCNPANGQCEPVPGNDGEPCPNDGDLCKVDKTCSGGQCVGGTDKDCSALGDACNIGTCDPVDGSCYGVPLGDGDPCNDGNSCTTGEMCTGGACIGGTVGGATIFFEEDFADNSAGWNLGPEWEIGPAVDGGNCDDPALDHTNSGDNGLAGVEIGGCSPSSVSNTIHDFYYITSPVVDASAAPGNVTLQYWRVLHSDYTPYMQNVVEVTPDGANWTTLWSSDSSSTHDADWTLMTHDVTAYKSATMQFRWGYNIDSTGVFDEGSWSLDDVLVADQPCF